VEIDVLAGGSLAFSRAAAAKVPLAEAADAADVRRAVQEVSREVVRSLQSYQAVGGGTPVEQVYVAGATGIEAEAGREIARGLATPCSLLDPTAALELPASPAAPMAFLTGLGMAVEDRRGARTFDFLSPKRPAAPRDVRKIRVAVIAGGVAVGVLALAVFGAVHLHGRAATADALRRRLEVLDKQAEAATKLHERVEAIDAWAGRGQDWLDHLNHVSRVFPSRREAYATGLSAGLEGRRNVREKLTLDARAADEARTTNLRDRMRRAGYVLGKPGAPAGGTGRDDRFREAARVELFVPEGRVDPSAVEQESRPGDDVWSSGFASAEAAQASYAREAPRTAERSEEASKPAPASSSGSEGPSDEDYKPVEWSLFAPGSPNAPYLEERPVAFRAIAASSRGGDGVYVLPAAPKDDYYALELREVTQEGPPKVVLGYFGKRSRATADFQRIRGDRGLRHRHEQQGAIIRGRAWYVKTEWHARHSEHQECPVAVIVDSMTVE
jgi:hypothetical protein